MLTDKRTDKAHDLTYMYLIPLSVKAELRCLEFRTAQRTKLHAQLYRSCQRAISKAVYLRLKIHDVNSYSYITARSAALIAHFKS